MKETETQRNGQQLGDKVVEPLADEGVNEWRCLSLGALGADYLGLGGLGDDSGGRATDRLAAHVGRTRAMQHTHAALPRRRESRIIVVYLRGLARACTPHATLGAALATSEGLVFLTSGNLSFSRRHRASRPTLRPA